MRHLLGLFSIFFVLSGDFQPAWAEVELPLHRRVAVFPIAEAGGSSAEEAWWQVREMLTKDQRFFVASRRFMINRGVFQARKILKPADAIILGKILDAQALITLYLDERSLNLRVYDGENGYLVYQSTKSLHPAIPLNDQLVKAAVTQVSDFVLSLPYQGFLVIDDLQAKPVYEIDGKSHAQIYVGGNQSIDTGDVVHFIQAFGNGADGVLSPTMRVSVVAEGVVKNRRGDRVEVEVQKIQDQSLLIENSLARFPREVQKSKELFSSEEKSSILSHEYLSGDLKAMSEAKKDHNSTSSSLAWILNLAGFILLAF